MFIDRVAILIKKAALEFEKMSNPVLLEYGLTGAQYKLLKYLFAHPAGSVRQVDMERYYSMTHPTAIGLLEQLEKKGYIQRSVNPSDKRSRVITLTDKAYEMQEILTKAGDKLEEKFTAKLTESERKQLITLLQKLMGLDKKDE